MRRFKKLAAGFCLATVGVLWPLAMDAAANIATDDCEAAVVDMTSDQVLDVPKIEAATVKLERETGADVRVRAFNSAPTGSLSGWRNQQIEDCASWRGPDGDLKANMLVYVFSMDRNSGFYYGANYEDELGDKWNDIRDDTMGDRFREGDFTGGIIAAQDATVEAFKPSMAGTYAVRILGGVLLLAVVVGSLIGFALWRRRRAENETERLRQQALAVKGLDAATRAMEKVSLTDVEHSYKLVNTDLNEVDKRRLAGRMAEVVALFTKAVETDAIRANMSAANNPEKQLSTEQYKLLVAEYGNIEQLATAASVAINDLEDECDALLDQIQRAPATLDELEQHHNTLAVTNLRLRDEGYKQDESTVLNQIDQLLKEARRQVQAKKYGQALDELEKAAELCAQVEDRLDELQTVRDRLTAEHDELTMMLQTATSSINGDTILESMQSNYDSSCWQETAQLKSSTEASLVEAQSLLDQAQRDASMNSQNWEAAESNLTLARQLIGDPMAYVTKAATQAAELANLVESLDRKIRNLSAEADSARRKTGGWKGSQETYRQQLEEIGRNASELEQVLAGRRPAYFEIDQQVTALAELVTAASRGAKAEHQRVEDEEEAARRRKRQREEEERRRRNSNNGGGFGTGFGAGAVFGSSGGFGGGSSGGSSGGGDGSFGGSSGGGDGSW